MLDEQIRSYITKTLKAIKISAPITLTDGKSGAPVYRINVTSEVSSNSGSYIIKINNEKDEASKSRLLHSNAPLFKNRLVELKADEVVNGSHVLLYLQANDSILYTVSLEQLKISEQVSYLEAISYELMKLMNKNMSNADTKDFFTIFCLIVLMQKGVLKRS